VTNHFSRRRFLAAFTCVAAGIAAAPQSLLAATARRGVHPRPRPGITAARVVPAASLRNKKKASEVFDMVREIPQVIDGIHCYCGCAELPDSYSLLSCFESDGMAQVCHVCQGEARLAHRLHTDGKSLDEIRAAIDAKYA
jgi:hypothetical protein